MMTHTNILVMKIIVISFLILTIASAYKPRRKRIKECVNYMKIYCDSEDVDHMRKEDCARAVIRHWKKGQEIVAQLKNDDFVTEYMKKYHEKITGNMVPGDFKNPVTFCIDEVNIDDGQSTAEYNLTYNKCMDELSEFGHTMSSVFYYSMNQTNIHNENYYDGHYAIRYLDHISENIIFITRTSDPIEFCRRLERDKNNE